MNLTMLLVGAIWTASAGVTHPADPDPGLDPVLAQGTIPDPGPISPVRGPDPAPVPDGPPRMFCPAIPNRIRGRRGPSAGSPGADYLRAQERHTWGEGSYKCALLLRAGSPAVGFFITSRVYARHRETGGGSTDPPHT